MNQLNDFITKVTTRIFALEGKYALICFRVLILLILFFFVLYDQQNLFENEIFGLKPIPTLLTLALIQLLSNLILALGSEKFLRKGFSAGLYIFDVILVSFVVYSTQGFQSDLFLIYFLVIFLTVIAKKPAISFLVAGFSCLLYGFLFLESHSTYDLIQPGMMLRFPLLLVAAFFSSTIAQYTCMKEDFIGSISHELKTPLSSIKTASDILLAEFHSKGNHLEGQVPDKMLSIVKRSSDKMLQLLEDFSDSSRYGTEKMRLKYIPVSIDKMIGEIVEEFLLPCDLRGLSLTSNVESNLPTVRVDPIKLRQVFLNLLGNAIKFTSPGGTITIEAQLVRAEPTLLRDRCVNKSVGISVRDTGVGIHNKQQKRIFEKFYQGDGSVSPKRPGIGLGLALVKSIIEAHQGTVSVKSNLGKGSTFYFQIPITPINNQKTKWQAIVGQGTKENHPADEKVLATETIDNFMVKGKNYVQL